MTDVFEGIPAIRYEGPDTDTDLAYRFYDEDRIVLGRRMADHLRFATCMWHGFVWPGSDVFGAGTFARPWNIGDPESAAAARREAGVAFAARLGIPFYTWHDVDVSAPFDTASEYDRHFGAAVDHLERLQLRYRVRPLWGTANLFSHPRYAAGAATNPDPEVFAWGALQVSAALDATRRLGGDNYVLWGGREGYETLFNTDMARELDNLGRFLSLAVDHKHRIGFKGAMLIEPKPFEPTKHQYDFDVGTVHGFLRRYGLEDEVKVNIEANHATLASHSFEHEIAAAAAYGLLGSIDANRGDPQNGWDTDQFPNSVEELTRAMLEVLRAGGLTSGGFNFDAKVRRQSVDVIDLVHGHVGGIDAVARGLLNAAAIIEDGRMATFREERYAGWDGPLGRSIHAGEADLPAIGNVVRAQDLRPSPRSGRQEWLENLQNRLS